MLIPLLIDQVRVSETHLLMPLVMGKMNHHVKAEAGVGGHPFSDFGVLLHLHVFKKLHIIQDLRLF